MQGEARGDDLAGQLLAGAGQVDISPKQGTHIAGSIGLLRTARLMLDPLMAKALILERSGRRFCFISLDVCVITNECAIRLRQTISERTGIEMEAILIHATQTHSAPAIGHFMMDHDPKAIPEHFEWVRGGDDQYEEYALSRALDAVEMATQRMEPVEIGAGSAVEGRIAFNRRMVMRDGSVLLGRPDPNLRYIEGPVDPEVGVICLRNASLRVVALVLHYTCHPTNVGPAPLISADWPGAWANEMAAMYGPDCVGLVINGACGNVYTVDPFTPGFRRDYKRMGRVLAAASQPVLESMTFSSDVSLGCRSKHLSLPLRQSTEQQLSDARDVLRKTPSAVWADEEKTRVSREWLYAVGVLHLEKRRQRNPLEDYEIQAFRLGKTALICMPGEPFAEAGLQMKLNSPTFPTYVVHNTRHAGYLPTERAFENGGYEVQTWISSRFVRDALRQVTQGAIALLVELDQSMR